jgi:predicted RNase H-like HicB family nuclease
MRAKERTEEEEPGMTDVPRRHEQTRRFPVLLEWDEADRVWTTYVPSLGIADFGESREEALHHTQEAIALYLETAEALHLPLPAEPELVQLDVALP